VGRDLAVEKQVIVQRPGVKSKLVQPGQFAFCGEIGFFSFSKNSEIEIFVSF
jgi:hypothetical protein